ncbi:DUF1963 domain-containing protein [Roseobacter sp. HKCCA0434]|uniref:DUF1963 domain-containing protein n=1 Tax=Roseobacter sp. HKCCA0434 TaxID=3079297 RepID=UPI002905B30F|nr:DUF1963 domain-containing protein [Roseobacter sp. HKCCA0434]
MEKPTWRKVIEKKCSTLAIGGFRPSNALRASCFGEVRATEGEVWPQFEGKMLWPVCQLNLLDAPYLPECLSDLAMVQLFVMDNYRQAKRCKVDTSISVPSGPFFLKTYGNLENLKPIETPTHGSPFKPFEAKWNEGVQIDYPTHDCLPFDFEELGLGEYYDQDIVAPIFATKLGGWPSCVQSEPWWDYRPEGKDFEFAFQIDSEEKANCWWGDNGVVYFARHQSNPDIWAVDWQSL